MSQISNRFFVTALDDGTTLHGNLASDKSLSQAWSGTAAIPNWTIASEQPTIYLTMLAGAELVQPKDNYKWLYNGQEITFNDSGISTNPVSLFQKTTKNVTYGGVTKTEPALKIIGNLASSSNVDVDMITFQGEYEIGGSAIAFSCDAQIRISTITGNGFLGVINFVDGKADIVEKGQVITMYGKLHDASGAEVAGYSTKWYVNDSTTGTSGQTISGHANAFQVTETQVVDHATIKCEFYTGTTLRCSAFAGVDDMQDPEFMYIQYNGANGNAASLRSGDTVTFYIWVGTREDASVIGGPDNPTFSVFKARLLDGDGTEITGHLVDIPDRGADGLRQLSVSGGKASIKVNYSVVSDHKKNLTGIIIAYSS